MLLDNTTRSRAYRPYNLPRKRMVIMISVLGTAIFYAIGTLNMFISKRTHYGRKMTHNKDGTWPSIAWLLAFPNSGTFYTTVLTEMASGTTTATNYGEELGQRYTTLKNVAASKNGPFRFSRRPFPKRYILTKNHCTGYCTECDPSQIKTSLNEFEAGCVTGTGLVDGKDNKMEEYSRTAAKRVVHLIRNPFDNIVARFHFAITLRKSQNKLDWKYENNRNGFRKWCRDQDNRFPFDKVDWGNTDTAEDAPHQDNTFPSDKFTDTVKDVPCYSEFFQYVQWHNNAFSLIEKMKIPEHSVRYENYHSSFRETVSRLFDFLGMDVRGKMNPFVWNGGFVNYFTDDERDAVKRFVEAFGTQQTNDEIKFYFESQELDGESTWEAMKL